MCADGVGAQLRYVVACVEVSTHRSGLLEVGHTVAIELRDLAVNRGGLSGLRFEVSKHSFSKNSRMELRPLPDEPSAWWREVDVPNPQTALYLGWQKAGFTCPDLEEPPAVSSSKVPFKRPGCLTKV